MATQCRARLTLPNSKGEGDVIFTCNRPKGHEEVTLNHDAFAANHAERGRVRGKDGSIRTYLLEWSDEAPETWRGS